MCYDFVFLGVVDEFFVDVVDEDLFEGGVVGVLDVEVGGF